MCARLSFTTHCPGRGLAATRAQPAALGKLRQRVVHFLGGNGGQLLVAQGTRDRAWENDAA
jgi:hypothetical protein